MSEYSSLAEKNWDLIVVGGGMVGAATALGMANLGLDVLLLERHKPDLEWQSTQPFSMRVSALTRSSENILRNLNAWQGIEQRRAQAFTSMQVWEESRQQKFAFLAEEIFEDNLGYTVENSIVQAAIWEQIEQNERVTTLFGLAIESIELPDEAEQFTQAATVRVADVGELQAQLVVAADGANSKSRQLVSIGLEQKDYEQCAVVGCVRTEKSHQNACWQRYTADGPFAFLAMAEGYSSIAWYLPLERMSWAMSLDNQQFAAEIEKASGGELGAILEVAERGAFPLVRRHANHYVKPRFALVGDAAHTINPQAGQGVNIGLLDAAALIDVTATAIQKQQKIGLLPQLRHYERWRRGDNAMVQRSMEFFDWFYEQGAPIKANLRHNLLPGFEKIGLMKPFKHWLMNQVLHGRDSLPGLAKPSQIN